MNGYINFGLCLPPFNLIILFPSAIASLIFFAEVENANFVYLFLRAIKSARPAGFFSCNLSKEVFTI